MRKGPRAKTKQRKNGSGSRKKTAFRFGRLKVVPIDMRLVYAAYE